LTKGTSRNKDVILTKGTSKNKDWLKVPVETKID
jgi:hypothetical protein